MDTKSDIFQNLNGALGELSIAADGDEVVIYNNASDRVPAVIHGNGPTKVVKALILPIEIKNVTYFKSKRLL